MRYIPSPLKSDDNCYEHARYSLIIFSSTELLTWESL